VTTQLQLIIIIIIIINSCSAQKLVNEMMVLNMVHGKYVSKIKLLFALPLYQEQL
jgi:hypothetical protein